MQILFGVLAGLCLLYYLVLACYAGIWSAFIWFWLVAGVGFAILTFIMIIESKVHFLCRIPKLLTIPAGVILVLGCLLVTFLFGCVVSGMTAKPKNTPDYIIVLGAQIRGEWITRPLRFRLEAALAYYETVKDTGVKIIVSGGQGTGESCPESLAMKNYLVEHGVEPERVLMEDQSTTTRENLEFSYKMICDEGDSNSNVVICSNNFHIFRAVKLAKHLGIRNAEGLAAKCDPLFLPNYMVRDSLAIFKEFLLGNLRW